MKSAPRHDGKWVLATAECVANQLKHQCKGTAIRVQLPWCYEDSYTGGWAVGIGDLGRGRPSLEIWYDRYSRHDERKLWAGFHSRAAREIRAVTRRVPKDLKPAAVFTDADVDDEAASYSKLKHRLARGSFTEPISEFYDEHRECFFGFYDPTRPTVSRINLHFCERAVSFFLDVARSLPGAKPEDLQREVYPQLENRKRVASHLHRERSRLLAADCKIRDGYKCQVCGFRFDKFYGDMGNNFAEAHHLIPLSLLREGVKTAPSDLITVCANCHRMLHRMDGKREDIARLKAIIRKRRA